MKLVIIFNKDIPISPEKVCVHTAHCTRDIVNKMNLTTIGQTVYTKWEYCDFKTVLLRGKMTQKNYDDLHSFYYKYTIVDAGRDGVYEAGTVLGHAVLVPNDDESFKRIRLLRFKDLEC